MSRFTQVAAIDPKTHAGFVRMREKEGFREFGEADVAQMTGAPGLKFVIFADDPNKQKETLDIVVIGPEVRKTLPGIESAWVTDTSVGRALAARWGMRRLPAIAVFRGADFLGAVEGLTDWGTYEAGLAEIARRTEPARRTIAVLSGGVAEEDCCGG